VTKSVLLPLDQGEQRATPEPQFCVASNEIKNQRCVKCQAPMVLTGVNTARLDFDVLTFECFKCESADKVMTGDKARINAFGLTPSGLIADERIRDESRDRTR
jgi:RNase P subunit RPR2